MDMITCASCAYYERQECALWFDNHEDDPAQTEACALFDGD